MATEKIINTRIQLKYDSYENWSNSTVTLKSGEMAIAYLGPTKTTTTPDNGSHPVLFKVGPGKFNDLPWASALAADVYAWAKKEHLDVNDLPTLPITVVDTEEGKFVTDIEYANDTITIHRGNVAWDDIQNKPNLVNSVIATDDDIVTLTPDTAASGDVTITGAHKKYNKAGSTTDANSDATTAGASVTIKVPTLTVDAYGHTEFNGETSHTITIPNEVAVGDGNITIAAGAGLTTGGTFNVNQDADTTITLAHKDTSDVADVTAADRTYVKSLTFDDFGHVTGVDVGTETVIDTNTAHDHIDGIGTKVTAAGGINGDVAVNLNIKFVDDTTTDGYLKLVDADSDTEIAKFATGDFVKDSFLENVSYSEITHDLTFTFVDNADNKQDIVVPLDELVDVYTFEAGKLIDVETTNGHTVISHEAVAAPTESAGSGRKYLTGVTTDGYGHITGFTTATEVDQDLSGKKTVQTPVNNKINKSAHVLSSLSQNANGDIAYEVKELTPAGIGAKAVQTAVTDPTANGNALAFIDSINQNEQGVITATKKTVDLSSKLNANGWVDSEYGTGWRYIEHEAEGESTIYGSELTNSHLRIGSTEIADNTIVMDNSSHTTTITSENLEINNGSQFVKLTGDTGEVQVRDVNYYSTTYGAQTIKLEDDNYNSWTLALPYTTGTLLTNNSKISADQFKATAASAGAATDEVWVFNCGSSTFLVD